MKKQNKKFTKQENHWLQSDLLIELSTIEDLKFNWKIEEAIKRLNEILYEDPWNVFAVEELADCQLRIWDDKKALKTAKFALQLNSQSYTWNYLAWFILWKHWKNKEAVKYLTEANKIQKNNPEILRCLWWSTLMWWLPAKWIILLERARNISPEDVTILNDLAVAYIQTGEVDEWVNIIEEIQNISPWDERATHTMNFLRKEKII